METKGFKDVDMRSAEYLHNAVRTEELLFFLQKYRGNTDLGGVFGFHGPMGSRRTTAMREFINWLFKNKWRLGEEVAAITRPETDPNGQERTINPLYDRVR